MDETIPYNGILLIPILPARVSFHEKEECSLNAFQSFLIEAIDSQATIRQMIDATKLPEYVIRSGINQLISQKLLVECNGTIALSALSKRMLQISRVVKQLNGEAKSVTINQITGELSPYISTEWDGQKPAPSEQQSGNQLILSPLISDREILGLSLEDKDISAFFHSYMDTFAKMSNAEISDILKSLYIELEIEQRGKTSYQPLRIHRLPCLSGQGGTEQSDSLTGNEAPVHTSVPSTFRAEGSKVTFTYKLKSRFIQDNQELLSHLSFLYQMDKNLLSESGIRYMEKYKDHSVLVKRKFFCTLDRVSGKYTLYEERDKMPTSESQELQSTRAPQGKTNSRKKVCLKLPSLYDPATFDQEKVIAEMMQKFHFPEDIEVILADRKEEPYDVVSSLDELQMPYVRGGKDDTL